MRMVSPSLPPALIRGLFLCLGLAMALTQPVSAQPTTYRINAGGSDYLDPDGNLWISDEGFFNTGNPHHEAVPIAGTDRRSGSR